MSPGLIAAEALDALIGTVLSKYPERPKDAQFPHVVFMVTSDCQIVAIPIDVLSSAKNSTELLTIIRTFSFAMGAEYVLFACEVWFSEKDENLPVSQRSDARSAIYITLDSADIQKTVIIPIGEDGTLGEPITAPAPVSGRFTDLLGRMECN